MNQNLQNCLILLLAAAALAGCRRHAKEDLVPFDELAEMARSDDADKRYEAVKHLADGAPKHTEAIPLLVAALSDDDENVRYIATAGLARFGKAAADAVPKLTELVNEPNPKARGHQVRVVGETHGDPSAMVRAGAAHALSTMGAAAAPAMDTLAGAAVRDSDKDVRDEAKRAMRTIKLLTMYQAPGSPPAH